MTVTSWVASDHHTWQWRFVSVRSYAIVSARTKGSFVPGRLSHRCTTPLSLSLSLLYRSLRARLELEGTRKARVLPPGHRRYNPQICAVILRRAQSHDEARQTAPVLDEYMPPFTYNASLISIIAVSMGLER